MVPEDAEFRVEDGRTPMPIFQVSVYSAFGKAQYVAVRPAESGEEVGNADLCRLGSVERRVIQG